METKDINRTTVGFINDKSPIMDLINNDLIASGVDVIFRSENIMEGNNQLSSLKTHPDICIIDLDFFDRNVMKQLRELRSQYPTMKLIAHSDMDDEKVLKQLFGLDFSKYVLIGEDIKKAIDGVVNGR
ncbi:DNA-binding response regulator [Sphingobacterium sp. lm-10]|uniref:DNA-binding response regulator n=1 Tax=Sphingobacterium sp. lm-10 TaxID=2944904 RepID=UPI002021082D|nr:DNA-binding response regulator [Sphingobacterium sp. lm-10]MCL7987390.1 DNA-binding response regulator [Sphingobacterium sp. lm-10]